MDKLPDELLGSIFKYTIYGVNQLLTLQLVCKKFHRISNSAYLWYYAYKIMYPTWSSDINYAHQKQPIIDWKYLLLKLQKQKLFIKSEQFQLNSILGKKSAISPPNYQIQEPFVSDIDPITNTGIIAVSKYCKYTRHKILFYRYPSYELIRKLEFQFQISDVFEWSCQIIGIQTLEINKEKIRLFAVSLNQPSVMVDSDEEQEDLQQPRRDEVQNLWKVILIYRLHEDGSTTCLAHLETNTLFLGRGIFFFNTIGGGIEETKKWLQITSPNTVDEYDADHTVFMLAYGLNVSRFAGYSQIIQLDLRTNETLLDPSKSVYAWDDEQDGFVISTKIVNTQQQPLIWNNDSNVLLSSPESSSISSSSSTSTQNNRARFSAQVISNFYLGPRVSCMIHFRYPTQLNHLIITGNFHRNELFIYDWRFGLNVGVFPYNSQQQQQGRVETAWGFESGWAIPPPFSSPTIGDMTLYGPRLIVVGDGQDIFEINIWDISQLLRVKWDPFNQQQEIEDQKEEIFEEEEESESEAQAMVYLQDWWNRKTPQLKKVALNGYLNKVNKLPYTITIDALKRTHTLHAEVKYTAYVNLQTWSYLLREDGHLSVMDIESGKILKTINMNGVAEDVNVIGDGEIIVTKRHELLSLYLK